MSSRRSSAFARRKSATPQSDDDVDMIINSPDGVESDAEGEMIVDGRDDLYELIDRLSTSLSTISEDGEELAAGFQRIPSRRTVPDYFEIISNPVAFSTVRGKIQKKQYANFTEFVKDVAQIFHNAQVYNRPSAPIFNAAIKLQGFFKEELHKLVQSSQITKEEAALPDLGELPPVEDSPLQDPEAENLNHDDNVDDDQAEEEDDDDGDDDDDDGGDDDDDDDEYGASASRRRKRRLQRPSAKGRNVDIDEDAHKGRGRPPMVLTPVEARISSILKGVRRLKASDGALLVTPFEKLPDRAALPDYYQTILNPIALDNIKKKAKRKKYNSVDRFLDDMNMMFENAKAYNEDQSEVYKAAAELQKETQTLAEQEKAKSDDEFRDENGKLPVALIEQDANVWRVGDWVHIRNPNDLAKPTVGQIFRMWQDREGEKWINACWYYRPEQTVHRFEKHFFEHEVVKTGQYRDHQIGEVVDRCFVMFVTRFNKGRPRGLPADKHVYVCESRYNEENFRFNKIKTWASCVPDEVRDRDYEMDLFDGPRQMKKVPSPIKHLLREDAKVSDELPRPTWGSPNAPPIVGAVHRRPPESHETPPPDSSSMNPAASVESQLDPARRNSAVSQGRDVPADHQVSGDASYSSVLGPASPGHDHTQTTDVQPSTSQLGAHPPHQTPVPLPQIPAHATSARPAQYMQQHQSGFAPGYPGSYSQTSAVMRYQQVGNPTTPGYNIAAGSRNIATQPQPGNHNNAYNPPRPPEVYTLPDSTNEALPFQIRAQLQRDNAGRVLFFTAPPSDRPRHQLSPEDSGLGHSLRYIAEREDWRTQRENKRKARDQAALQSTSKRIGSRVDLTDGRLASEARDAVDQWFRQIGQDTEKWKQEAGLSN
ncbi:hypothetical protein MY5147_009729 [Beauveria neobassiana]